MARVLNPLGSEDASGTVKGLTFGTSGGKHVVRRKPVAARSATGKQQSNRSKLGYLVREYGRLTDAQRQEWRDYAVEHEVRDRFGRRLVLTGQQAFVRHNMMEPEELPWDPAKIVGVKYWWRADGGITLIGGKVDEWKDRINLSGASAVAAINRPSMSTIGGEPAILGDGVNEYLRGEVFPTAYEQPFSVWAVVTVGSDNDVRQIWLGRRGFFGLIAWNWIPLADNYYLNWNTGLAGGVLPAPGTELLMLLVMEEAVGVDNLYANGVQVVSGNAGTQNIDGVSLLARPDGVLPSDSKMAEVGVISGIISAPDRVSLAAYVLNRYGVG